MPVAFLVDLPTPEQALRIFAMRKAGRSVREIAGRVFGSAHGYDHRRVTLILRDPHGYDPYVDRVAVDRALSGDREVWESLTHYERRDVMLAINARRAQEHAEDVDWRQTWVGKRLDRPAYRRDMGYGWLDLHGLWPEWIVQLAEAYGIAQPRLLSEAARYAEAAV